MYGSPPSAKPPANDLSRPFQMSSGLLRYRSAPSSLIGEVCEDFLPVRSSSPETETMFAGFLSPDLHLHVIRDKNLPPASAGGGVGAVGQRKSQHPPPALPLVQHPAAAAAEAEDESLFHKYNFTFATSHSQSGSKGNKNPQVSLVKQTKQVLHATPFHNNPMTQM